MLPSDALERALARLHQLAVADEAVREEFLRERARFFGAAGEGSAEPSLEARLAELRYREWFHLERPSEPLDGVPVLALMEAWLAGAAPEEVDLGDALAGSLAGVFEVSEVEVERGVWLRDLLGHGEYALEDPALAATAVRGDVLIGRIFPLGDSVFAASAACHLYRNPELLKALGHDLARLRGGRRGSLRISQLELEHMFRPDVAAGEPDAQPGRAASEVRAEALRFFEEQGLDPERAGELVRAAGLAAPDVADPIGEVLDRLAFETEIELEPARRLLLELRASATAEQQPPRAEPPQGEPVEVSEALAEFDRGRAAGRDLEELFRELEIQLGVEPDGDEEPVDPAPDFPGVVGAVVEEFLWEVGLERGEELARAYVGLRRLGNFGREIGVFENLGPRDLLAFAGLWLLEERQLSSSAEARQLLDALADFCRWSEEAQQLPLWRGFDRYHAELVDSLPRLVEANLALDPTDSEGPGEVYRIDQLEPDGRAQLIDLRGGAVEAHLEPRLCAGLRPQDLVRGVLLESGRLAVQRCYPAAACELLQPQ